MQHPVLTIFYQFDPWHATVGGIQTVIANFIKYAPAEFTVRLVGTAVSDQQAIGKWAEVELAGRKILFLPLFKLENDNVRGLVPTSLRYTLALLRRRFSSDFMHFHRLEPMFSAWCWPGHKTLFVHNDIRQQMQTSVQKDTILWRKIPAAYFAIERLLIGRFSQIFSCNSNALDFYSHRYPRLTQRMQLIKNTVDTDIFFPLVCEVRQRQREALAKRLDRADGTRFLLFAGRLHPQKDPILLLRSFAALNDPHTHLLIAGAGELTAAVKSEIAQLQLSAQVTLLGALSQAELADLYRVCDAFVLTSLYEGLPMTVLEALACGVPVVTTRCGETPKLLSAQAGRVCEDRTPGAIATALAQVLQHPDAYPVTACTEAARPYWAKTVVTEIYHDMWQQWRPSQQNASGPRRQSETAHHSQVHLT